MNNLCFAIMPFGKKKDDKNREMDFDLVYEQLIEPAIEAAGLESIIAREETIGGFIHQPMYERLLFCKYAVTDITFFNANVFYELGIRHACRKFTTVLICEESSGALPFDVRPLRTVMYKYDFTNHAVINAADTIKLIKDFLEQEEDGPLCDSPIAETVQAYPYPDLEEVLSQSKNTPESFKKWVLDGKKIINDIETIKKEWRALETDCHFATIANDEAQKAKLTADMQSKLTALETIEQSLGDIKTLDLGQVTALLLAYRCLGANDHSIKLLTELPQETIDDSAFFQHELAHAYNKTKELDKAKAILENLITKYGHNAETCGILGSVYKRKAEQIKDKNPQAYKGMIKQSISAYKDGFDANPMEYYPGINLLNLLFFLGDTSGVYDKYLPLVSFAIERRIAQNPKDYWAQASGLELEVLNDQKDKANEYLEQALAAEPFPWEKDTTIENLQRIRQKKQAAAAADLGWIDEIITALN